MKKKLDNKMKPITFRPTYRVSAILTAISEKENISRSEAINKTIMGHFKELPEDRKDFSSDIKEFIESYLLTFEKKMNKKIERDMKSTNDDVNKFLIEMKFSMKKVLEALLSEQKTMSNWKDQLLKKYESAYTSLWKFLRDLPNDPNNELLRRMFWKLAESKDTIEGEEALGWFKQLQYAPDPRSTTRWKDRQAKAIQTVKDMDMIPHLSNVERIVEVPPIPKIDLEDKLKPMVNDNIKEIENAEEVLIGRNINIFDEPEKESVEYIDERLKLFERKQIERKSTK